MGLSIYKQKGRFALLLQIKYLYSLDFYLIENEKGSFLSAFSSNFLIVEPFHFLITSIIKVFVPHDFYF